MSSTGSTLCKVKGCRFNQFHLTKGHRCGSCGEFGHGQVECGNTKEIGALRIYDWESLPPHLQCKRPYCNDNKYHTTESHSCSSCYGLHSEHNCPHSQSFQKRESNPFLVPGMRVECPICRKVCQPSESTHTIFGCEKECTVCMTERVEVFLNCGHAILCWKCCKAMSQSDCDIFSPDTSYETLNYYFLTKYGDIDGKVYTVVYAGMGCVWNIRRAGVGELVEVDFYHSDDVYSPEIQKSHEDFIEGFKKLN